MDRQEPVALAPTGLTEVTPLREVPRTPGHCGRPMQKMQNPASASGKMLTVWVCNGCGTQQREQAA